MAEAKVRRKTCAGCRRFTPDPALIRYPTGGNGWCSLKRGEDRRRRENAGNWCDRWTRRTNREET